MTDTTTAAAPAAAINPTVQDVVAQANAVLDQPAIQTLDAAIVAKVAPKIPKNVRSVFYEVVKWVGLVGAGATAAAAVLDHKNADLYLATGGFLLTSLTGLFAKAHIGATA